MGPIDEFRDMVKALHRAGIEVILDVVFNHTAEGNERGPTLSFRGIDNLSYYILEHGGEYYANYTGCGNTLNGNHPIVRRMIVEGLRYWVQEMHVDGFRFDLASVHSPCATGNGNPLPNPPVIWDIESDPVLATTKLFAEAWDAAGLYQVGTFVGDAWKEMERAFSETTSAILRGVPGAVRAADRMVGSPEIFGHHGQDVQQSVNFATCHDGFTLNDLVSYNDKHNEDNGESNRDGQRQPELELRCRRAHRRSAIESIRSRQIGIFLTLTMFSLITPMFVMGDELGRAKREQQCLSQDNEISWLDWSLRRLRRFASVSLSVLWYAARGPRLNTSGND